MLHATRAAAAAAILLALTAAGPHAQLPTARTVRFASGALGGQATFAVLVPPDYETSNKRYPVLYLLHGGTQNHTAFPARSWFGREVSRRDLIVVMPHVPQVAYRTRGASGAPLFEQLIVEDLVRYVDARYRTIASREARAIGGLSLGGFGALMVGFTHSQLFGTVGAFSGAFSGGREAAIANAVAAVDTARAPFVYLACGVEDELLPASRTVAALLDTHGIAHEYREVPGGHTWDVWDPQTLAFLDTVTQRPGFRARP